MQKTFFSSSKAFAPLFVIALMALLLFNSAQSAYAMERRVGSDGEYKNPAYFKLRKQQQVQKIEAEKYKRQHKNFWLSRADFVDNSLEMQGDRFSALEKAQELEDQYDSFGELSYEDRMELRAEMREKWQEWTERHDMQTDSILGKRAQKNGW